MNKILYVSDLDGTLLRSDEKISTFSCNVINELVDKGMIFSYATARSGVTSSKVTKGLNAKIPIIVYNGAFILDNVTKERIVTNLFTKIESREIYQLLDSKDISPIVYSLIDDKEKFSYNINTINNVTKDFVDSRKNDIRDNPVSDSLKLSEGDIFYFTCIGSEEKLLPIYKKLNNRYYCVYQKDIYTNEQWLEIMPLKATKANAILQLKKLYNCDKIISFGDGINDIPMFKISDQCYAVNNAVDELKYIATSLVYNNNNDGVAKWLKENVVLK